MLARLWKMREEGEDGFTLIELLVVMIIIGILAAIAIPAFLAQRTKGYDTAVKNDMKNTSIAEESFATDNSGAYGTATLTGAGTGTTGTGTDSAALLADGAKLSDGVTVAATAATSPADSYVLIGTTSKDSNARYCLSSANNEVVSVASGVSTC